MIRAKFGQWIRRLADRLDPPAYTVRPNPRGGVTIAFRGLPLADVNIGPGITADMVHTSPAPQPADLHAAYGDSRGAAATADYVGRPVAAGTPAGRTQAG